MTLWIGNGAVLKSYCKWQLKEFWKLNNSVHELFIFNILVIVISVFYSIKRDKFPVQQPLICRLQMFSIWFSQNIVIW